MLLMFLVPVALGTTVGLPRNASSNLRSWRVRYLIRSEFDSTDLGSLFFGMDPGPEVLEDLSSADDTPLASVELAFDFPMFGQSRRVGFVNANGAVGFEPRPPCGTYFGSQSNGVTCSLNTSWYDLVAGLVTDLNPGSEGQVLVGQSERQFTAAYENVTLFGAAAEARDLNMAVTLYDDGRVEIRHQKVFDEVDLPSSGRIVGLRPPEDGGRAALTSGQERRKRFWGTSVAAVYAGEKPRPNRRIVACPVPDDEFCAEIVFKTDDGVRSSSTDAASTQGSTTSSSSVLVVEVVAPFFGCAEEAESFGFFCALVDPDLGTVVARSADASFRNLSNAAVGAVAATCDFNDSDDADAAMEALEHAIYLASISPDPVVVDDTTNGGNTNNNPPDDNDDSGSGSGALNNATSSSPPSVGRRNQTAAVRVELRYETSLLEVVDGGDGDGGYDTETPAERSLVSYPLPLATTLSTPSSDDEKPPGTANYCEGTWLEAFEAYPLPILDCDNAPTTFDQAYVDADGTCCSHEDSDCLGTCDGDAVARKDDSGTFQCCVFDCLGICNGHAERDCKGECNGLAVIDDCDVCGGLNADMDACGVCFGTAATACPTASPQPQDDDVTAKDDDEGADTPDDEDDDDAANQAGGSSSKKNDGSSSSSSRRASRVASSVHDHPWVVVIVALEIFVSIACFRSCTSRRGGLAAGRGPQDRGARDYDAAWAESHPDFPAGTTLAPRDLDNLVHAALQDVDRPPNALPRPLVNGAAATPAQTPQQARRLRGGTGGGASGAASLFLFTRGASQSNNDNNNNNSSATTSQSSARAPGDQQSQGRASSFLVRSFFFFGGGGPGGGPGGGARTPSDDDDDDDADDARVAEQPAIAVPGLAGSGFVFGGSLRGLRASVAEAYQGAITSLCATPRNGNGGDDQPAAAPSDPPGPDDETLCGICLDDLADRRAVVLPNCKHTFHAACLSPWLTAHNSCPFCKRTVVDRVYPQLGGAGSRDDDDDDPPEADDRGRRRGRSLSNGARTTASQRRSRRHAVEMRDLTADRLAVRVLDQDDAVDRGTRDDPSRLPPEHRPSHGLPRDMVGNARQQQQQQQQHRDVDDLDDDAEDDDDDDDDAPATTPPSSPPTPHPSSSSSSSSSSSTTTF